MQQEQIRLNKYLASCGICSRRAADEYISAGKVYVNGKMAMTGQTVSNQDEVVVNGKVISQVQSHVVLAYYKPVGVVCTEKDKHAKKDVIHELGYSRRVTYAGRLDKDSEGLLIMTDDGNLIDAMMRGANRHEKEYIVRVDKEIKEEDIAFWEGGVYLSELKQKTRPCKIEKLSKYTMKITITQGLNRQIRRMCGTKQYKVLSLKRVRVMTVQLADLKPGEYRELTEEETKCLYEACHLAR